jgi:4'-phosphopantetheinyl transferase
MATLGLTEAAVAPWAAVLDADERARAARFAMPRSRIAFIAAHALTRAALGGAIGVAPAAFGFAAGAHGKPQARLDGRRAEVAFNLSHTDGMVGVAVALAPGLALGFDLESLARRVPLALARRYFTAAEATWLDGLPGPERTAGFLRLWTLKEAFIKATGKGLSQDLSRFWFSGDPAVVSFAPDMGEVAREWSFAQRVVGGGFVAAVACRGGGDGIEAVWREVGAAGFDSAAGLAEEAR